MASWQYSNVMVRADEWRPGWGDPFIRTRHGWCWEHAGAINETLVISLKCTIRWSTRIYKLNLGSWERARHKLHRGWAWNSLYAGARPSDRRRIEQILPLQSSRAPSSSEIWCQGIDATLLSPLLWFVHRWVVLIQGSSLFVVWNVWRKYAAAGRR
jgi:hypothetical protein